MNLNYELERLVICIYIFLKLQALYKYEKKVTIMEIISSLHIKLQKFRVGRSCKAHTVSGLPDELPALRQNDEAACPRSLS